MAACVENHMCCRILKLYSSGYFNAYNKIIRKQFGKGFFVINAPIIISPLTKGDLAT